jgi:hypothetical protein
MDGEKQTKRRPPKTIFLGDVSWRSIDIAAINHGATRKMTAKGARRSNRCERLRLSGSLPRFAAPDEAAASAHASSVLQQRRVHFRMGKPFRESSRIA